MTLKGLHSVPVFNFIIKFIKVNILKKLYLFLFNIVLKKNFSLVSAHIQCNNKIKKS